jgi:hypothetical protein
MTPEEGGSNMGGGGKLNTSSMTQQEYRNSIHRRINTLQGMTKSEPLYQYLGTLTKTFNYIVTEGFTPITFEQSLEEIERIMKSDKNDSEKLSEIQQMQFLDI